jgi:hypothetical protein
MHGSSVLLRWQCVLHGACVCWALQLVLCPYVVASCFPLSHLLLFWWYALIVLPARAMRFHQLSCLIWSKSLGGCWYLQPVPVLLCTDV